MLTRRMGRLIPIVLLLTMGLLVAWPSSQSNWTTAGQELGYEEEVSKGRDLFQRGRYEDALKSFKRANEMRQKKSAECYAWMAETYRTMGAHKNAIESADKVIEFANGDPQLLLRAYNNKGLALRDSAEKKDQKKLQAAEAVFKEALKLEGVSAIIHYSLGITLLQLHRDEEGVAELKQYVKLQTTGNYAESARRIIGNPRRAREHFAPDFSFTSSEGEHITLEDLQGKVVLLDFWGTWCSPCVESVPELRNLHKRYSKDGTFVMLGISSDGDEGEWKEFTAKNKMIWPQYRDHDRRLQRAFGVFAFPTYIVLDHEGVVRYQSVGMSWASAGELEGAIRKQLKNAARSTEAR